VEFEVVTSKRALLSVASALTEIPVKRTYTFSHIWSSLRLFILADSTEKVTS
jgi:hypothetical protein